VQESGGHELATLSNVLPTCTQRRSERATFNPLIIQLLIDVRHRYERFLLVSAHRARAGESLEVLGHGAPDAGRIDCPMPYLQARRVETVSVSTDDRVLQDLIAKLHQNAGL